MGLQLSWLEHCVDNAGVVGSSPTRPTKFQLLDTVRGHWGISSAGRAPALQAGGRRFDPVILHHQRRQEVIRSFNTKAALSRNVKGLFVVDQYHLINRLFFKNSQSRIRVVGGNCTFVKVQCRPCRWQQEFLIASKRIFKPSLKFLSNTMTT